MNILRISLYCAINFTLCGLVIAGENQIKGVIINQVSQFEDDDEAPFEVVAKNKAHKCGGKPSSRFIVFSESEVVGQRRFEIALMALRNQWPLTLITGKCDGRALRVFGLSISRTHRK